MHQQALVMMDAYLRQQQLWLVHVLTLETWQMQHRLQMQNLV